MARKDFQDLCISESSTIREVIRCIDKSGAISLALLVDGEGRLLSVLTDGDVRRGLLRKLDLDASVSELLAIKQLMPITQAVTAPLGTDTASLIRTMQETGVRQLPLVNEREQLVDIVLLRELLPEVTSQLSAVIMAGGMGKRLAPLTDDVPKPMLPVGGRPLLERIVAQLKQAGIHQLNITTHYKPEKIIDHFGTGLAFGVNITYVQEDRPLGTGGALRLMQKQETPILVINGDVLTKIDFQQMLDYHRESHAEMTVAVNLHTIQVPYGVVECENSAITAIREKPDIKVFVNAGIYLLEPSVYDFIPADEHFNMTDLVEQLIKAGRPVVSFPIREYWMDIGRHQDYAQAQEDTVGERIAS